MDELFEYLVPLQGLFRKKRNPKMLEKYKSLDDIDEIIEDFRNAGSFFDDAVRIGTRNIFRKEKYTIFYVKDIVKATFVVHGDDACDEYSSIDLTFANGDEEVLCTSGDVDPEKVTADVFDKLNSLGIKTFFRITR